MLRVLQVEDSESDAALISRLLAKAGFEVQAERVETAAEMAEALRRQTWDLIIADYQLPSFDAPAALKLLQETGLDIPFIVVSGQMGEEIAVSMMKAGAADYLMKDRLSRLAPAVERELREAETRRERRRMAEALAAEKERLLVTLRSIGDGVITTDPEGRVTLLNRVAEELTGWPLAEAVGRPLREVFPIFHEQTRQLLPDPVKRVLAAGSMVALADQALLVNRRGQELVVSDSGAPIRDASGAVIGVVLVFRDDSEKRRAEESLRQADKLRSLGVLAGGIAHDFNNLLSGLFGYIEMARHRCETREIDKAIAHLSSALAVFARAKDLTRQLLTFAKGGQPIRHPRHLPPLVRKSAQFVLSGSNVALDWQVPDDLWPAEVDENQFGQVVDNLVLNARQAMPNGGTITIAGRNLPRGAPLPTILPPRDYVQIAITDHGSGIAPEHLSRIFDPFFSTKRLGSGLGLATAYSIMKRHDGLITVESEPGRRTTFTLLLPRATAMPAAAAPGSPRLLPHGESRILVMDDEPSVREICLAILQTDGYRVDGAAHGEEAIALFREAWQSGHPYRLVILDLTVPGGMSGRETLSELRKIDPDLVALASSGYAEDPIMANPTQFGFAGRLAKPYLRDDLLAVVRQVLPD
ncbi:MAG: PAS/PAC sensor hybrid histidine kinase [Candidatus Ozemobacter sibiricus]|uniref:histidine kinase n=1 Tax=Candidatus Ozemobacter sibiricus TaxID=2268124 RepID=A0A367ZST2_9BACT|nr:MAG: PAS/PAC sensor hybrid histidine kinase [Candidatus Ozemobacter sibiricus]